MLFQVLIAKEYKRENYLKLSHKYLQAFLKTDTNHPKGNHTLIISNFHKRDKFIQSNICGIYYCLFLG